MENSVLQIVVIILPCNGFGRMENDTCSLVGGCQYFRGTCCLHLQGRRDLVCLAYGGSRLFRIIGTYVPNHTV